MKQQRSQNSQTVDKTDKTVDRSSIRPTLLSYLVESEAPQRQRLSAACRIMETNFRHQKPLHRALSGWLKVQMTNSKSARWRSAETLRSASRLLSPVGQSPKGEDCPHRRKEEVKYCAVYRTAVLRRFAPAHPCAQKPPAAQGFRDKGNAAVLDGRKKGAK